MNLENRLRKLESIHSIEPKIIVVKFGNEINRLTCGEEEFNRNEVESEDDFIKRIREIIEERPNRQIVTILVGNF